MKNASDFYTNKTNQDQQGISNSFAERAQALDESNSALSNALKERNADRDDYEA